MIPGLKDFTEAMNATWPVALAACLGASAILIGETSGVSYLSTLPPWLLSAAFIIAVFSAAIVVVAFTQWCLRQLRKLLSWRARQKTIANHLKRIDDLPHEEIDVLIWAAQNRKQVFLTTLNHRRVEPLLAKGYVQMVPGTHDILDWPYKIPDHVWNFLVSDFIRERDTKQIEYPFGRSWP